MLSTAEQWDRFISAREGHLLQSWAWGTLKSHFGWTAYRIQTGESAAQILFRQLPLGFTIAYIPKGPIVNWSNLAETRTLFQQIHAQAKKQRAIFLKVEPNVWRSDYHQTNGKKSSSKKEDKLASAFLHASGFIAADTIQPQTTSILDIVPDADTVLAAMKQKTRYNIRLSRRKGVQIRTGGTEAVKTFYDLSLITGERDDFGIHSLDYYQQAYQLFEEDDRGVLFLAEFEDEPLAGLMAFRQGNTAYYFYGASSNKRRNLMPTYLVQWAAIEWAKQHGCTQYDLWGIPDASPTQLEAEFQDRKDGLWGVYRFKRGFGGKYQQSIGAFDYVYRPWLYRAYRWWRQRGQRTEDKEE